MSNSLTINTPNIVQQNTPLRNVPSGSTATPDYSVKYVPQDLTEAQKAQARQNIGAAEEGGGGQQVQANWNETDTDSPAYIQNKPTIPSFPAVTNPIMFDKRTVALFFTRRDSASLSAKYDWFWNATECYTSSDPTEFESISLGYVSLGYLHFPNGGYWSVGEFQLNIYNDNEVWMWANDLDSGAAWYNQINFNSNGKFNLVYQGDCELYNALYNPNNTNFPGQCWTWLMSNGLQHEDLSAQGNLVLADATMATLRIYEDPSSISGVIGIDIYVPKSRLTEFETRMKAVYGNANYESYIEPKVHTYDFISQYGLQLKMITLPTIPLTMTDALGTVIDGDFVAQNVTITPAV